MLWSSYIYLKGDCTAAVVPSGNEFALDYKRKNVLVDKMFKITYINKMQCYD